MKPIKTLGKSFLSARLEAQVKKLRKAHQFQVIAVAGSVGKTSTKLAIASMLAGQKRVRFQEGNYNDRLTVPLIFFGQTEPGIFNVAAWLKILGANRRAIKRDYPYDYVVVELGTDGPGQMEQFAYLQPDLVVLTSIADEHMEYFKTLDAVAAEELQAATYAKKLLVNADDVDPKYLDGLTYKSYAAASNADYMIGGLQAIKLGVTKATLSIPGEPSLFAELHILGKQGAKIALAAAATAHLLGFDAAAIRQGIAGLEPFAGRMQILPGIKDSTLLDDTYNASPIAVKAALDTLYAAKAPHRIAILGSMNELGEGSAAAHQAIGSYCDPKRLDLVVTIGEQAGSYLGPAASKQGCAVKSFIGPYEAGAYVAQNLQTGSIILAKGSQNGVFAEEALKSLLKNPEDAQKLVRQSPYWLAQKQAQFGKPSGAPAPAAPNDPSAAAS
ncbi:MAG TPA: Mur ligase family protein [Candidatus Saccharimonadales bacterium]